ncbi:MAG: hypothetical protein HYX63_12225 [Gammaproteobacteria bacterium]|nr:hypothetical protein [Gammaproteobacteria bacterium]
MTTTTILVRFRATRRALLLRELAPVWDDVCAQRTLAVLDDLVQRKLVAFSPSTDRWRYLGPR